jgi:hypothetical protein
MSEQLYIPVKDYANIMSVLCVSVELMLAGQEYGAERPVFDTGSH